MLTPSTAPRLDTLRFKVACPIPIRSSESDLTSQFVEIFQPKETFTRLDERLMVHPHAPVVEWVVDLFALDAAEENDSSLAENRAALKKALQIVLPSVGANRGLLLVSGEE